MEAPALRRSLLARRINPSLLTFVASSVVLGAFTRLRLLQPFGASDLALAEMERLVTIATLTTVVTHALVATLAARLEKPTLGVAALLAFTAAAPQVVVIARAPLGSLLGRVAPYLCASEPQYCPPSGWSPLVGCLVGALLAPVVVTAVLVRRDDACDAHARMLWSIGVWVAMLTMVLHVAKIAALRPTLVAWAVATGCILLAAMDTLWRGALLRKRLRSGAFVVTEARDDDPDALHAYASTARSLPHDHVLRENDGRSRGPYRGTRHDEAIARVPRDLGALQRALDLRLTTQTLALLLAAAVFVSTTR